MSRRRRKQLEEKVVIQPNPKWAVIRNGIIAALCLALLLFFPIIRLYLFPPVLKPITATTGMYIIIPKIDAQAKIIPGVDPQNSFFALQKGVASERDTALPGDSGTIYLFAQSPHYLLNILYENTMFLRSVELLPGDVILIDRNGKKYFYAIMKKEIVDGPALAVIRKEKKDQLLLETITPTLATQIIIANLVPKYPIEEPYR